MELPKEKMVQTVVAHKNRIVKATNEIVEKSIGYTDKSYDETTATYVKKRVNQIVSNLSIIGGFCGQRERRVIGIIEDMSRPILKIGSAGLLEDWCIMVNGIIVDFTKTPFRFIGGEFGVNLRSLEAKIRAFGRR